MKGKLLEIVRDSYFMFPFNLFRRSSSYRMDDLIGELSGLCLDLGDDLRREKDEEKRKKLLAKHLEKVTTLNKENNCKIPDFLPGLEWINVKEPLSIYKHLQGKVVILDFFTYCCINCMHILPDLKKLEQLYPVEDGLVVIGVHSAKFTNERVTDNIHSAVGRYEINHPVVNDNKEAMWRALSVHCWPTLYVIGPRGEPLLFLQGEGHFETLRSFISQALAYYGKAGLLSKKKINIIDASANKVQADVNNSALLYPGKVAISNCGNFIAVADSGHHRILVADLNSNKIIHEIGGPNPGLADGKFNEAKFFSPQGLSFFGNNIIFVADTENHSIRQIDIKNENVTTIIGDGRQGRDYQGGKTSVSQQISSPWDVCIPGGDAGKICFIAMAGTHQIWAYFLEDTVLWKKTYKKGACAAVVGSGREENRNNHYPMSSGLAQPSGLTYRPANNDNTEGGCLYFADSESSTVRQVDLLLGRVSGVVGGAVDVRNLFAYGDSDGNGLDVKLQHPLCVAYCSADDKVYVADTYNHKIKVIDPEKKTCTTVKYNPPIKLNEPAGLYAFGDKIYIADTNNHSIRVLNTTDRTISTIELIGNEKKETAQKKKAKKFQYESEAKLNTNGGDLHVTINAVLPKGTSLSNEAPSKWTLLIDGDDKRMLNTNSSFSLNPKWNLPMKKELGDNLTINGRIFVCSDKDKTCSIKEVDLQVRLVYTDNAPNEIQCNINCEL